MSQTIKIEDSDNKFSQIVQSLRTANEPYEITDNDGQIVAVVLSSASYETYQAYQKQREADFAILDDVAEAFKDVPPDELTSRIDQAVEEVKILSNTQRAKS